LWKGLRADFQNSFTAVHSEKLKYFFNPEKLTFSFWFRTKQKFTKQVADSYQWGRRGISREI